MENENTPLLPRADGRGGVFDIRGISADSDQSVVGNIVSYGMGKGDGLTIIDGRDIDTSPLELVDEGLNVIGSHT